MLPLLGGLITGGAGLLSSFMSSTTSAQNTQAQIAASQQQQATQNQFQEQMSNTAYQRASADMKAAGLNPSMMFGSGSAASSPSGSSIQAPMPTRTSPLGDLGSTVGKAVNSAVEMQTFQKMTEEIANLKALQAKTVAETVTEQKRPALVSAHEALTREETLGRGLQNIRETPATQEAEGVLDLPKGVVQKVGVGKYAAGALGDVISPVVSSALRLKGLGILRDAMRDKSATTFRRGYDAGLRE